MAPTPPQIWASQLRADPSIDKARFAAIVKDLLAHDGSRFLRTLYQDDPDGAGRILAETLSLHHGLLAGPDPDNSVHRAYLHLIVNTAALIPARPAPDFDALAWARDYASLFDVGVQAPSPDGPVTISVDQAFEFDRPGQGAVASAQGLRELGQQINYRRYGRNDVIPSRLFAFEPASTRHSLGNALWLADVSQLVYLQREFVQKQLLRWGFDNPKWIASDDTDTQVVVAACSSHVVVAFRGTRGGADILTDLKFRKTDFRAGPVGEAARGRQVHRGFLGALDSVWDQMHSTVQQLAQARPQRPVFVCGHSLGAALATLAARRLQGHGQAVAGVYLYGSPRVGNDAFCDDYNQVLQDRTFQHVNRSDIVTSVPPRWLGYRHVAGQARRFEGDGHSFSVQAHDDEPAPPPPADAQAALVDLKWQADQALDAGERFRQPAPPPAPFTYGTHFEQGRVDEHSIGEYLFKFACGLVDEQLNRRG